MHEPQRENIMSMRTRVAVLAALFTYVEFFVPVYTVSDLVSGLTTALSVGVIAYTGLKGI